MAQHSTLAGFLLVVTGIFIACNIYSLIPLYHVIGDEFSIPAQQVASGSFSFTFCYAVGLLFFGTVAERIGLKRVIVSGLGFAVATSFLVSLSTNSLTLIIFRGLQGFTLASFAPVSFNYCFHIFSQQRRRTFWIACINVGFLCAGIIGQLISSKLMSQAWQFVYISYSIIYLFLGITCFLLLPGTENRIHHAQMAGQTPGKFRELLRNPSLRRLYLIVLTLLFSFVSFFEGLGYYFADRDEALQMIRIVSLPGVIPALCAGLFINKWGARKLLQFGSLLGLVSSIAIYFSIEPAPIAFFASFFVAAIALLIPAAIEKIGTTAGKARGKALALYSFTLLTGASFGSVVAAIVSYHGLLILLLLIFAGNSLISSITDRQR